MPRHDQELQEFPSASRVKLHRSFFQSIRDRIETIRPVAGSGIQVESNPGYGLKISVTGAGTGAGLGLASCAKAITLDVCKNGAPDTIIVLGFESVEAYSACVESSG